MYPDSVGLFCRDRQIKGGRKFSGKRQAEEIPMGTKSAMKTSPKILFKMLILTSSLYPLLFSSFLNSTRFRGEKKIYPLASGAAPEQMCLPTCKHLSAGHSSPKPMETHR